MNKLMIFSAIALLILTGGCKKEAEPEKSADSPQGGVASVEERMADKAYVKQLDGQRDEMKRLRALIGKATNAADRAAVTNALERNRQETMRIIRERMLKK